MAILVTGGAGYIGSVTVDDLIGAGEKVIVLDDLSRGFRDAISKKADFVEGKIGDQELVRSILDRFDVTAVMHFSAFAYVGESVEKPELYHENNVIQTVKLLDVLNDFDVKQFVFSSTCATYGEPQYIPIDEDHPQSPTNPYGQTKLDVEFELKSRDVRGETRFVALRYFNACGATELRGERHEPETHIIPLILETAAGTRPYISVFGGDYPTPDGTAIRDYIHVSDLSQAHILALRHLQDGGTSQCVNLGNGQGFSVLDVIEAARKVTGKEISVKIEDRRPGDPSRLIANAEKARSVLGWNPQHTNLESVIESAWKWRRRND